MKKWLLALFTLSFVSSFVYQDIFEAIESTQLPVRSNLKGFGSAEHVLILGYDGLGAYYLKQALSRSKSANFDINSGSSLRSLQIPTIEKLVTEGAASFHARVVFPILSGPNWASILTGAGPEEHGIGPDNDWVPPHMSPDGPQSIREKGFLKKIQECGITRKELSAQGCLSSPETFLELPPIVTGPGGIFPTLFRQMKDQRPDSKIAVAFHWDWFYHLMETGPVSPVDIVYQSNSDLDVTNAMSDIIRKHKPDLMFLQFDEIDAAGHKYTFGSEEYYSSIEQHDKYTKILLNALEDAGILDKTVILMIADHGATIGGNWHADADLVSVEVPFVVYGAGVKKGKDLGRRYVRNMDISPTALHALGVEPNEFWIGRAVTEAFE